MCGAQQAMENGRVWRIGIASVTIPSCKSTPPSARQATVRFRLAPRTFGMATMGRTRTFAGKSGFGGRRTSSWPLGEGPLGGQHDRLRMWSNSCPNRRAMQLPPDAPKQSWVELEALLRRSGKVVRLVQPNGVPLGRPEPMRHLIKLLQLAHTWWRGMQEDALTATELANRHCVDKNVRVQGRPSQSPGGQHPRANSRGRSPPSLERAATTWLALDPIELSRAGETSPFSLVCEADPTGEAASQLLLSYRELATRHIARRERSRLRRKSTALCVATDFRRSRNCAVRGQSAADSRDKKDRRVEGAVSCEPLSAPVFPVLREFTGKIELLRRLIGLGGAANPQNCASLPWNSLRAKQEIEITEQGNDGTLAGNLALANSEATRTIQGHRWPGAGTASGCSAANCWGKSPPHTGPCSPYVLLYACE